jgi:hypothetical protein
MNANELATKLANVGWDKPFSNWELLDEAATMLRQQQAEIEKVNAEWVLAAMALGKCVQENHDLKAEIAILRKAQEK